VRPCPGAMSEACQFELTTNRSRGDLREARMVELASYGLIGLTAVLVVAFCFACSIELPSIREKSSYDLIDKA
jgi:hypothetical protein